MEEKELPRPLTLDEAFGRLRFYKQDTREVAEALQDAQTGEELLEEMRNNSVLGVPENQPGVWDERIKVGDVVYRSYTPIQCGVVTKVVPNPNGYFSEVTFVGLKKTWTKDSSMLNDFTQLVADHKRKYDNQNKTLKALKRMKLSDENA